MTTRYVNTASSAGGDGTTNNTSGATRAFATLLEAINSLPSTLSDAYTIYCTGSAADTSAVNQTPFDQTTSASNYLLIIGEQSPNHFSSTPSGKWDTSKYRIEITNSNGIYNNTPCHWRIEGVQVQVTVSNGSSYDAIKSANANQTASDCDNRISHCIVKGVVTSGALTGYQVRPYGGGAGGTAKTWNNVAWNCTYGFQNDFSTGEFYNNTAYGCGYGFVENASMKVVNCLAAASVNQGFVGTFTSSNYNAESDGNGAPGANSRTSQTFTFLDAAAGDFRLSMSDAGARNFGTSDPGSGLFSDDLVGYTRSGSWDIGASEAHAAVALAGTATASITESDIVAGGKTIILTADGDTWVPANGTPTFNSGTTKGTTAADGAGGGGGSTGNGTLTCTFPSGYTPVAGHFALMIVYLDQGAASTPTDWSAVTGSPFGAGTEKLAIFYKVLVGGESDPQTTISGSALNASNCANMAIYTGVGSIGAIGTASNGTGTPMTAGAITTTANNSIVCFCCGRGDNENSSGQTFGGSSTGVNERLDGGTAAGNDAQVSMADKTIATSGSSSGSGSATTSATDPYVGVQIELVPSTPFASARQAIINGLDSAQAEGTGWDAVVKAGQGVSGVVRTSDTVCTITLDAFASYGITTQETVTATIPAAALLGATSVVAAPTFTVDADVGGGPEEKTGSDSGALSASESRTLLGLLARTDTGALSATESRTLLSILARSDSGAFSASETATLLGLLSRTDSGNLTAGEQAAIAVILARSDSGALTVAESVTLAVVLARTDTGALSATESATLLSILARSDTGNLTATESRTLLSILARTDAGSFSATETAAIVSALSRTDSGALSATETAAIVAAIQRSDTGAFTAAEVVSIFGSMTRADSGVFGASEIAAILSTVSRSDSGALTASELAGIAAVLAASDGGSLTVTESAVIAQFASIVTASCRVAAETRSYSVEAETRGVRVPYETRTYGVQ